MPPYPVSKMIRPTKTADDWFAEYGVCHQNPTNKLLHWICIPLIMLSLLALIWSVPVPAAFSGIVPGFNWCWLVVILSSLFYWRLSVSLGVGMLLVTACMVGMIVGFDRLAVWPLRFTALIMFVLAWIGQFVGHKIEGAKPAFVDDLKFLLIGPLWLLGFVYRKLGIRY